MALDSCDLITRSLLHHCILGHISAVLFHSLPVLVLINAARSAGSTKGVFKRKKRGEIWFSK